MFGRKTKSLSDVSLQSKLALFMQLLSKNPITTENFLDSFSQLLKILQADAASLYIYEKKTHMFVLKQWNGIKPSRFSISGDYEFVKYLGSCDQVVRREEFSQKNSNELRQPALLYYQHTVSNVACPIMELGHWYGIINLNITEVSTEYLDLYENLLTLYAGALRNWLQYQDLSRQNKKHSELSHVKNQLLANVTHELQTPLNGILGISAALLDDPELGELHRGSVQLIQKSGKELHKTVNNILELMQIEAKKSSKVKEKVEVLGVIKEVAMLFSETCRQKKIKLLIPESKSPVWLYVQADQVRTVLMNLMGNAIKFTEQGEVRVSIQKSGEFLHIAVSDTGIGIEENKLNLIFEEFYQGDGSHTRVYGGTGLGLAIVKKIVSLHGGRIWVESEQGSGSKFEFTLPLYPI